MQRQFKVRKINNMKVLRVISFGIVAIGLAAPSILFGQSESPDQSWQQNHAPPLRLAPPAVLEQQIVALGHPFGNHVAISVRDIREGWAIGYNEKRLCPQQSVSKFWVALTLFDKIDQGLLSLSDRVLITSDDLTLFHQPIRALVGAQGYETSIGDLLQRALTESDNTANDALLRKVGGPNAVRSMLAQKNITSVRFGPGERLLQSGIAGLDWKQSYSKGNGFEVARARLPKNIRSAAIHAYAADPVDGAAPESITEALVRLKRGELLSQNSSETLLDIMSQTKTGRARLKSGISAGWTLAHKTGTGPTLGALATGFNDVGILTAPDGHSYALAIMVADSDRPIAERQRVIANVARDIIGYWATRYGANYIVPTLPNVPPMPNIRSTNPYEN